MAPYVFKANIKHNKLFQDKASLPIVRCFCKYLSLQYPIKYTP